MKEILLEGKGLKRSYRQGHETLHVLRGVDVEVTAGQIVVIVGPSGAGKSTLLNLLAGLDRPTHGAVNFAGRNLYGLSDRDRAHIRNDQFGFVFQFYHLVPELTALENITLPAFMARRGDRREREARARELLREVGLEKRATHRPAELSGGEQQRVAVARALMNHPKVVFCDEPTGNLDQATGAEVLKLLVQMKKEQDTAFVIVTHEPAVTKQADRVLSLKDGQLWD